jgi:hypothetical protein
MRSKQIEERYDHADGGDQLRDSINRFQLHIQALSNWIWFDESELLCRYDPAGRLR